MEQEKSKEMKKKILKAFGKIEIMICRTCGAFISKKEYDDGEGSCGKCWSV